jgi:ribosomal protein L40E
MAQKEIQKTKMADEKFCSECGSAIKVRAEVCPKCGVRQTSPNSKNKVSAALLAFFLGGIGGHKFYLGKWGWAFFTLCFAGHSSPQLLR